MMLRDESGRFEEQSEINLNITDEEISYIHIIQPGTKGL